MNLQRSAVLMIGAKASGSLISFIGIVIFARELSSSELGIYFLFQMGLAVLAIPASFGRGNAIIKRVSEGDRPNEILGTAVFLLAGSCVVLASGMIVLADIVNQYIGAAIAIWLTVGIFLRSFYVLPLNILKGELRVGEAAVLRLIQKILWFTVSLAFLIWGFGVHSLIYGLLTSFAITSAIGSGIISTSFGNPSFEAAKSLVGYWKYTIFSFVDATVYNWADIFFIGLLLSQSDVGVYEIAWRVTLIVILVSSAIESVIFPQISSWDKEGAQERIEDLLPGSVLASLYLVIPAFCGTVLFSEDILSIVFGAEYGQGWLILIILMSGKLVESIDRIFKNFLEGIDLPNLRMRAVLLSVLLNVVLNGVLIWHYGIHGAAVATVLAFATSTLITTYYLKENIKMRIPTTEIGWCILSAGVMSMILFGVKRTIRIDSLLALITVILLGVIIYVALTFIHPPIRDKICHNINNSLSQ